VPTSDHREAAGKRQKPGRPEPAQTDRLRADIDRGRTGDKVPASDPSAAPLGTDDEAGGTPADVARTRLAAQQRVAGEPPRRPGLAEGPRRPGRVALAVVGVAGVLVLVLVALWIVGG
jgi:hypothetical protein